MSTTDNLDITELADNQTQKELTINTALNKLDNATQGILTPSFTSNACTLTAAQFKGKVRFKCGGSFSAVATLTVPLSNRLFLVDNLDPAYPLTVKGVTGTTVGVPAGYMALIHADASGCKTVVADSSASVSSVVGAVGAVTLADLLAGGVAPLDSPAFTTQVTLPVVAANDSSAKAAYTSWVRDLVSATVQGLQPKPAARLATTTALLANTYANGGGGVGATLTASSNGALSVDGVAVAVNDIVLVKDEATASHNGLYVVTHAGDGSHPYILTRHADMDEAGEFIGGFIVVESPGSTNSNSLWLCTVTAAPTVGTTTISFAELNKAGDLVAGTGIALSGNTVALASVANGRLLANISGSAAAPTPQTLTAILDALLGGADGDIAVRSAGVWTAMPALSYAQLPAEVQNVTVTFPFSGMPGDSQAVHVPLAQAYTLPANFAGAVGWAATAPAADAAFTLAYIRSGTPTTIGTLTYAASAHTLTLSTQATVNLLANDVLRLTAPSPQDASLADVGITIVLQKT